MVENGTTEALRATMVAITPNEPVITADHLLYG
jgi:hypothetical protein